MTFPAHDFPVGCQRASSHAKAVHDRPTLPLETDLHPTGNHNNQEDRP